MAATPAASTRRARSRAGHVGGFGPAFDRDLAAPCVDADDDAARMGAAGFVDQVGIFKGGAAEDDAGDACLEPALDGRHVAHAAAELHRDRDGGEDGGDGIAVLRGACEGAVQVNHVKEAATGTLPCRRLFRGGKGVDGGIGHFAALQADAGAVLEVDGWVEGERLHQSRLRVLV